MPIKLDHGSALEFVEEQVSMATGGDICPAWEGKIQRLSELCETANVRTHIAFLGTALLARSLNDGIDPHIVKPMHAPNPENAYSARSLAEKVLVPSAIEFVFDLGSSGREPLNNQPYFRMKWLGDGTPISPASKAPFDYMLGLVGEISEMTAIEAAGAFRAFISVRSKYVRIFEKFSGATSVSLERFAAQLSDFVSENAENGRRAQAVAAGLFDTVFSPERVISSRINDPSLKHPGDVCVTGNTAEEFIKAVEVRDKPVSISDAFIFAGNCMKYRVGDVSMLLVAPRQSELDSEALARWAAEKGVAFRLFYGWHELVRETLYWSDLPMRAAVDKAVEFIELRLAEVEVSKDGYSLWVSMFRK